MKLAALLPVLLMLAVMPAAACGQGPATAQGLRVVSFAVTPNPVERGGRVTLTWEVQGASRVTLWRVRYDAKLGRWYRLRPPETAGAATGEWTIEVPHDATWQRTPAVDQPHWDYRFELEAIDGSGGALVVRSEEIRTVCHPLVFDLNVTWETCAHREQTTRAAFQPFERGHMIWRADLGQVYILLDHPRLGSPWIVHRPTGRTTDVGLPPRGLYAPGEHLSETWMALSESWRSALGWATALERTCDLTSQFSPQGGQPTAGHDDLYLAWPNGQVAHLIVYLSAQDQDAGPHWGLIGDSDGALPSPSPLTRGRCLRMGARHWTHHAAIGGTRV